MLPSLATRSADGSPINIIFAIEPLARMPLIGADRFASEQTRL